MTYTPTKILTFDEFISQYGDNPRYELIDGELRDMEPTGPHEAVTGSKNTPYLVFPSTGLSTIWVSVVSLLSANQNNRLSPFVNLWEKAIFNGNFG
jgi:hypothetical protein